MILKRNDHFLIKKMNEKSKVVKKKCDYLCVIKNEVKIYQLKIPYSGRFFRQTKYQARASVKDSGISVFFRGGGHKNVIS